MNLLTVSSISKQGEKELVVKDISFNQQAFEKIVIAGETGSGKSTLLKIIAGLGQPDAGQVLFEGKKVTGPVEKLIPGHPGIAYLSQDFELRNNYRMEELLSYANKLAHREAQTLYEVCRISHLLKRKNEQLSGGEKQRIAIARLLISSPKLLLLDEPFSNLDMIHKNILKSVIRDIGERLSITCIMVSHDPLDILSWADKIIVIKEGQILQQGSPEHIYREPVSEYVAGLFGRYQLLSTAQARAFPGLEEMKLPVKNLLIRPEDFTLVTKNDRGIMGKVEEVLFFGSHYEIRVALPKSSIIVRTEKADIFKGETVYVSLSDSNLWYM